MGKIFEAYFAGAEAEVVGGEVAGAKDGVVMKHYVNIEVYATRLAVESADRGLTCFQATVQFVEREAAAQDEDTIQIRLGTAGKLRLGSIAGRGFFYCAERGDEIKSAGEA